LTGRVRVRPALHPASPYRLGGATLRSYPDAQPQTGQIPLRRKSGLDYNHNQGGGPNQTAKGGPNEIAKVGQIKLPNAHRYYFRLYALHSQLDLEPGAVYHNVITAMGGKIIEQAELMGTYERSGGKAA